MDTKKQPETKEPTEIEQLKQELAKKEATITDYLDHLKRLQAEFENFIKRTDKERKEIMQCASERVIVKLLLVMDDLERAVKEIKNVPEETSAGIKMIFKNLHKILDEESVCEIKSVGEKFDPYKHEAILQEESEKPEGTILEELQKGYALNGKVIRYSKVKISKNTRRK